MTASQSTTLMRWKMRSRRMPALFTTQSMRPKLSMAVLMMRSAPCGSATLSLLETATPPAFLISATTWSATLTSAPSPSADPPRSFTTTLAPSAAARREISRPMPRPAPVTTITLPSTHFATDRTPDVANAADSRATAASPESRSIFADDRDGADVALREAAEVVRQAEYGLLFALALAGAALHLQVHLVDHAQARGADGVAEALEAAVDLAGHLAVRVVETVEDVLDGTPFGRDVQVLHGDKLRH